MSTPSVSTARKWATLAICALMALVPNIDLTALNQAIPHLTADLAPSATQILWIADAYGFALAGLLITMGGIGDRIGHKRLLLIGAGLFAAASAVTAYAPSAELLIAARALLGVAGATLMPSALSLIRRVFTEPKERTMAIGIFSGVAGLAVGLGPVLGGALLDHFWWGSVFLINVPIMLVVLLAGAAVLPESRNPVPGKLDLASVPLSVAACARPGVRGEGGRRARHGAAGRRRRGGRRRRAGGVPAAADPAGRAADRRPAVPEGGVQRVGRHQHVRDVRPGRAVADLLAVLPTGDRLVAADVRAGGAARRTRRNDRRRRARPR